RLRRIRDRPRRDAGLLDREETRDHVAVRGDSLERLGDRRLSTGSILSQELRRLGQQLACGTWWSLSKLRCRQCHGHPPRDACRVGPPRLLVYCPRACCVVTRLLL